MKTIRDDIDLVVLFPFL